ncbi:MAG: hypothetical protein M1813_008840 [Trichoglossum hirsutum]|jgi:Cu+-exporting ATPase|nr:MAG: hypothetical protein M1813_008840 [Trichoglossum hirsutum]
MSCLSADSHPITTTFLISNLSCPSSIAAIQNALATLRPTPLSISPSIVSQWVAVQHDAALSGYAIARALEGAGLEVYGVMRDGVAVQEQELPTGWRSSAWGASGISLSVGSSSRKSGRWSLSLGGGKKDRQGKREWR